MAVDGQAGCILRAYREHQMSASPKLLRELWPRIKLAMRCLINMDEGDGLLRGPQHNTLDQPWFGKVAWLSSLYVAAARACEEMAREMGDKAFEREARIIIDRGSRSLDGQLFNGRYYVQLPDPQHVHSVGSFDGCEIDQAFGQSWAWQVGLGRILQPENVKQVAPVALDLQLHARRRPVSQSPSAGPLVRDGRRGGLDHVHLAHRRGGPDARGF